MKKKAKPAAPAKPAFIVDVPEHLVAFADTLWAEFESLEGRKAPVLDVMAVAVSTAENEIVIPDVDEILSDAGPTTVGDTLGTHVSNLRSVGLREFCDAFVRGLTVEAKAELKRALSC